MSNFDRVDRLTHRTDVGLGSFDVLDSDEPGGDQYATHTYDVVAGYLVTLSPLALEVAERRLVNLTLVHTDYANEDDGEQVVIPTDLAGLDQLIALLSSARDYVARETAAKEGA